VRRNQAYRFGAPVGLAIACVLIVGGCATVPDGQGPGVAAASATPGDPMERFNRRMFGGGQGFDRALIQPLVRGYQRLVPAPIRRAVHNLLQNADEPLVAANDLLQARFAPAAKSTARFVANTTVGIGGLFDPATPAGLPHHDNDFGVTLGRYGFGPGAYLFVPVVGPTTVRDAVGAGVDYVLDPLSWLRFRNAKTVGAVRTTLSLADARLEAEEDLRALEASAADPYATLRSAYLQSRAFEIKGPGSELDALPDLPSPPAPVDPRPPEPAPGAASEPAPEPKA